MLEPKEKEENAIDLYLNSSCWLCFLFMLEPKHFIGDVESRIRIEEEDRRRKDWRQLKKGESLVMVCKERLSTQESHPQPQAVTTKKTRVDREQQIRCRKPNKAVIVVQAAKDLRKGIQGVSRDEDDCRGVGFRRMFASYDSMKNLEHEFAHDMQVWAVLKPGFLALLGGPFGTKLLDIIVFDVLPALDGNGEDRKSLTEVVKERNSFRHAFKIIGKTSKGDMWNAKSSAKVIDWVAAINVGGLSPPEGWAAFDSIASSIEDATSEAASQLDVLLEAKAKQGVQSDEYIYECECGNMPGDTPHPTVRMPHSNRPAYNWNIKLYNVRSCRFRIGANYCTHIDASTSFIGVYDGRGGKTWMVQNLNQVNNLEAFSADDSFEMFRGFTLYG
ncbi:Phospholipase D family [Corchorus capsularis]|uniref:Phospholipase D family n=1 Tax=Corchorus capsularis TaxID=210143 RepID=A0A1R3KHH8_COCAP|nr:Phospholipase D family [Corchorus capsularis]